MIFYPKFKFYIPDIFNYRIKKYYQEIPKKGSLKEDEVTDVLKRILKKSIRVSFNKYKKTWKKE